jgi:hypothetical protein
MAHKKLAPEKKLAPGSLLGGKFVGRVDSWEVSGRKVGKRKDGRMKNDRKVGGRNRQAEI